MFKEKAQWNVGQLDEDVLVLAVWSKGEFTPGVQAIDREMNHQLTELSKQKSFPVKKGECIDFFTLGTLGVKKIYAVYLGVQGELHKDELRNALGNVGLKLKKEKVEQVGFIVDSFLQGSLSTDEVAFTFGEALALSSYDKVTYKEKSNEVKKNLSAVSFYVDEEGFTKQAELGYTYGEGANTARRLVNIPGNLLTPTDLAYEAKVLAEKHGFDYDVLEEDEMESLGMGALLAVSQGSDQKAKMIVMRYNGNKESKEVTALVGKGLTFDAGGYSLKPAANMHTMKTDMGGAGAVLGAMDIIGQTKPKQNVLCVIPSSENLINGSAMKPGDVLRAMNGKTIEVRNTDAEGRLILADGVAYAVQLGATRLIDVATLTGACVVALGHDTTGAVTNDNELMERVRRAGEETGEPVWAFPNSQPYKDMLKTSDVADLNNAPGRAGGSITAGLFIGEFVGSTPWVHLDVAGTASKDKGSSLGPAGATGIMARTLAWFVAHS
ncbi:leucyl aminopeptidase [Shouchella hunanensis]|uniref:Probable cytosol aminopeptidase n=1 Tax=Shouchella hunanensis TaxID=766894 RepID=A0ABY7W5T6_9BACI|nr:leucyl aminopeptidase [Shouchella hunanensis]WDF04327.1 leucyl aminopeptidase [Shouchella hunanensis]